MKILVRSILAGGLALTTAWVAGCASKAKAPRVYHDAPASVRPTADLSKFEPDTPEPIPTTISSTEDIPEPPPAEAPAPIIPVADNTTINELTTHVNGIIEMAKRGVGGEALLAYVESNPISQKLTSENIIYLNDIGVPENVVATMIRQGESNHGKIPAAPIEQKVIEPPPIASTPTSPPQTSTPPPSTPPLEDNAFHRSLSPYGDWIYDSKHGWVWRPTVARIDTGWRPYCHGGRWIYSDVGWYWNSYYSWGWAPFHYGRWHRSGIHGWYWVPGYRWSPAWVHWRSSSIYAGWAPLPPGCDYVTGVGYMWHGSRVSIGFHFGLSHSHYTYCNYSYMRHRRLHRHRVREKDVTVVHNETKVVNNHITENNNTIINNGVSPTIVEQKTREPVRKIRIREVDPNVENIAKIGQIDANEKTLAVYRPKLQPPSNATSTEKAFKRQQADKTVVTNDNKEETIEDNSENGSQNKAISGRKIAKKNSPLKPNQLNKGTLKNNTTKSALIPRPLGRTVTANPARPSTVTPLTPSRTTASSAASPGKPNVVRLPGQNQSRIATSRSKIGPNSISRRPLNSSSTRLGKPSTPSRPSNIGRSSGFKQYSPPSTTVKKPIRVYGTPRASSPSRPSTPSANSISRLTPSKPSPPRYTPRSSTSRTQPSKRPSSLGTSTYTPSSPNYRTPSRRTTPSYKAPSRSYSPPSRSTAPSRSYSAPSRSTAPSRSYSPPSRSYSPPSAPSRPSAPPSNSGSSKERR